MRGGGARATRPPANAAAPFDLTGLDTDPLAWLLAPARPTAFWAEAWQARPAVFPATPAREAWVSSLPTTASLVARAGGGRLQWGRDVVAAKYEGGVRTDLNTGPWGAPVAAGSLAVLMRPPQSATLQVHHPQRWDASAWRLVAALEASLGCLVGANAYLTPAGGSQGLAPHWDDVDVLVLQVEGRKAWRVYEPLPEHTLATTGPSGDLVAGGRLTRPGRLALEAVLSPGDVLYIPRGTVHQAQTLEDGRASASSAGNTTTASNHLTLSFGQTKADRMAELIAEYQPAHTVALGDAPNDVEMLQTADTGVIVANPHRKALPALKGEETGAIIRTALPGPQGWNAAILGLLIDLNLR